MTGEPAGRRPGERTLFLVAAAIFVAAALWLFASAIVGAGLGELRRGALPALCVVLLAGAAILVAWQREHARLRAERAGRAEREHAAAEKLEQVESAARERLGTERRARALVERSRQAERAWAKELRGQVVALHRQRGPLGRTEDTTELVLQIAINVLDAQKGLLLTRPGDGSDKLSLACSTGFDHDPADSVIGHDFAERVLKHDETVRENDSRALERQGRTAADDEIDNLVAIPIYLREEFNGVVVCANRQGGFDEFEEDVLLALGDHAGAVLHNNALQGELRASYLGTVAMLSDAITAKDPFVGGHSEEVSAYVGAVAERLGLDKRRREELVFGSLLHDLGKIGISERILLKPGQLTPEERAVVQLHPRIGYRLVSRIASLEPVALGVLHHHERWDGSGYPGRLKGEQIPLEARIIGVADAFSAMTADRPYSRRRPLDDACAEIERCAGSQFDPEVATAFVEEVRRRPPPAERDGTLASALDDPELTMHRDGNEPLLGSGSLAVIDNLTLLYSHRYLHEAAASAAQQAALQQTSFAIVMAELCGLPAINARDGHAAGDEVIRAAARTLQNASVRTSATACRYGGPRLAMLVPGADASSAKAVLTEALADFSAAAEACVAAAEYAPGESGSEVIERAREALRDAVASARVRPA